MTRLTLTYVTRLRGYYVVSRALRLGTSELEELIGPSKEAVLSKQLVACGRQV
jgi:hypothetical protein